LPLDYEALGGGAGGGLIGSLMALFGFNRRLNRLECEMQNKIVCHALHESIDKRLESIQGSIDHLTKRIDFMINGRKP